MTTAATVRASLTVNRHGDEPPTTGSRRVSRRRRSDVENPDYAAFARRIIRAHGRRIAEGDVESLPDLVALVDELDTAIQLAVDGLREHGYSWAEIAARVGISKQSAHERWSRKP